MAETKKPNVLIIGGCGFIGRNLVHYLVSTEACNHIKVIDKAIPSVSHFSKVHSESFSHPSVKFKQGNAKSEGMLIKDFSIPFYTCTFDVKYSLKGQHDCLLSMFQLFFFSHPQLFLLKTFALLYFIFRIFKKVLEIETWTFRICI